MPGEFEKVEGYVSKHYLLVGGIAMGVVLLFVIIRSRSGGGASVSAGGLDPTTAALYAQESAQQTQAQAQQNALTADLQKAGLEAQYGLDLAKITTDAQTQQANTQAQIVNNQTQAQVTLGTQSIAEQLDAERNAAAVSIFGINAQSNVLQKQIDATTQIAQITASEQLGIANLTSQTQLGISNNATAVQIQQSNNALAGTKAAAGASTTNSWISTIGSLAGAALAFI